MLFPDESRLNISDAGNSQNPDGQGHIRVFEVVEGRELSDGQMSADMSPELTTAYGSSADGNV